MTTQRVQQTEEPAALPVPERRMPGGAGIRQGLVPESASPSRDPAQAQIAGALAALADKVDRLDARTSVSRDQRESALAKAREFVSERMTCPAEELIHAELEVARFLVGER